jgi:hypothetical protein
MMSGTTPPAARDDSRNWWVTGIVAIMIGLYIVVQPENAAELIRQSIALVLLALSVYAYIPWRRTRASA